MSLNVYVTSSKPGAEDRINLGDRELVTTLGPSESAMAVKIGELFSAVLAEVKGKNIGDGELTAEVTGSVTLKAEGGVKWMIFNIGGGAEKNNQMKVTLKAKL
jgi:hypothetical protein